MKHYCIIFLLSWILTVAAENILIMHSFGIGSHSVTLRSLADLYVEMGHNVTVLRYMDDSSSAPSKRKDIHEIVLVLNNSDASIPLVTKSRKGKSEYLLKNDLGSLMMPIMTLKTETMVCDDLLSRKPLMSSLKNLKLSLAVVDLTSNECGLAYAYNLGLPVIGYSPTAVTSGPILYTSQFVPPSALPMDSTTLTDNMTFMERVYNTVHAIAFNAVQQTVFYFVNKVVQKHYPGTPSPQELLTEMSGFYWDSHPVIEYPKAVLDTFGYIGGLHFKEPKPLPQCMERYIQSVGDEGFVLFNLGFSFSPESMSEERFQSYFDALSSLEQKVIAVSEKVPTRIPDNVRIFPDVPQMDILANAKISLFVGHGGVKDIMEALHFGVPMVGVSLTSEQEGNMGRVQSFGAAKTITKKDSKQVFMNAMKEVISEPSYSENAKRLSHLMKAHDDPREVAANIFNIVLKSNGSEQLKMGGRTLNIFQYMCMDIFILFTVVPLFTLFKVYCFIATCLNYLYWLAKKRIDRINKKL